MFCLRASEIRVPCYDSQLVLQAFKFSEQHLTAATKDMLCYIWSLHSCMKKVTICLQWPADLLFSAEAHLCIQISCSVSAEAQLDVASITMTESPDCLQLSLEGSRFGVVCKTASITPHAVI